MHGLGEDSFLLLGLLGLAQAQRLMPIELDRVTCLAVIGMGLMVTQLS